LLDAEIELRVASEPDIEAALAKYYGGEKKALDDGIFKDVIQELTEADVHVGGLEDDGGAVEADGPLIRLVNQIIVDAFKLRASDIHLEPLEKRFRIRYRIDGVMQEQKSPPKRLQPSIIARLKIQANMVISEHRIPQDGRIQTKVGTKLIDLRVSCLPTNHGESIVMRILDKEGLKLGLPELGFFTDDQATFERLIAMPDGILLVTGPTGSGKTTTLYSCLHYINRPDKKIITVEDPVEYVLAGINQVQVSEQVGLTFATALRAILRQAPNVVMIGEIRDLETASIAINASLTGHLVFSTLHTNDAPGAVARLVDIGVKPFLVASSTRCLMAQRLVRKVCKKCAQPYEPTEAEMSALGITTEMLKSATLMKGRGCANCSNTGNRGRFGVFEIFVIDDEARKLIYDHAPTSVLRARAREMGMRTLREDGIRKILCGMTTPEEVIRSTVGDEE
jgi:general secretion pathway protein E/type IV pilus assembly protein PilB